MKSSSGPYWKCRLTQFIVRSRAVTYSRMASEDVVYSVMEDVVEGDEQRASLVRGCGQWLKGKGRSLAWSNALYDDRSGG